MNIALVRCPCIKPNYPPDIGLAYINSFLLNYGYNVFVFDFNIDIFYKVDEEIRKKWLDNNSAFHELDSLGMRIFPEYTQYCIDEILNIKPKVIGFSVWRTNVSFTLNFARKIKEVDREIIIVLGGPECYPLLGGQDFIKYDYIDFVVFGEGEFTIKEIVDSISKGKKPDYCMGAIVKRNNSYLVCKNRPFISNLDNLPFPDFRHFPLNLYFEKDILFISSSRGCPRRCFYCDVPGKFPVFRYRSGESIFKEIRYQMARHPSVKKFEFASPALNSNLKELVRLCDLVIKHRLNINWMGNAIFNEAMTFDILKKLKEAGCCSLTFGLESGSQRILDKMNRQMKIKTAQRILRDCYYLGIVTIVNFIIGFPGETERDFEDTLNFIKLNKEYITRVGSRSVCWIAPYSYLFNNPKKFNITLSFRDNKNIYLRNWYDKETEENTFEKRIEKEKRFVEFCKSIGIKMDFDKIANYEC